MLLMVASYIILLLVDLCDEFVGRSGLICTIDVMKDPTRITHI